MARLAGLIVGALLAAGIVAPSCMAAYVAAGPREEAQSAYTTTQPNRATGFSYTGVYHAAGNPHGNPPYMLAMTSYNPPGYRIDTSVPDRCDASDLELATNGVKACPPGSLIGTGHTTTSFFGQFPSTVTLDVLNNERAIILLGRSPLFSTVSRGELGPGGTLTFRLSCYPRFVEECTVHDVLELTSTIVVPPYTKRIDGVPRSYATTPPTCPATRYWATPITFWWSDGSIDTVDTRVPCDRPARRTAKRHHARSKRHSRAHSKHRSRHGHGRRR